MFVTISPLSVMSIYQIIYGEFCLKKMTVSDKQSLSADFNGLYGRRGARPVAVAAHGDYPLVRKIGFKLFDLFCSVAAVNNDLGGRLRGDGLF